MNFIKKYKVKILFFLILLLAVFFRFYNLSLVPPSASLDEASIGWNAYSISITGHGEYGGRGKLPILLRAYDDYRPALYVYLVVPFVKFLGLSVLSERLPSAILSVLTVALTFFLIRSMFWWYKKKDSVSLIAMLLLAISPWHVYVSRLGHEVNLGLTIVVLATLLFFLFLEKKKSWQLVSSLAVFGLGFYSYQSEKVFIPLFAFSLICVFYKQVLAFKKGLIIGIILATVIAIPMIFYTLSPAGLLRFEGTSVLTNNSQYDQSAKQLLLAHEQHDLIGEVLNNRRITTVKILVFNYLSHFNPWWLFSNSDNEPFKAPEIGLLYLWTMPFLYLGLLLFFFRKEVPKQLKLIVACWVLIDFIAPGMTTQAPHALRALTLLPIPELFIAFAIVLSINACSRCAGRPITLAGIFLLSVVALQSLVIFFHDYFILFPIQQSKSFEYALSKAVPFIQQSSKQYKYVVVSNRNNLYQSYMYYLFYTKYDPKKYAKQGGTISGGFAQTHVIDNITFRPIIWSKEQKTNTLFVGNPTTFPVSPSQVFYYLDGTLGVTIVKGNQ